MKNFTRYRGLGRFLKEAREKNISGEICTPHRVMKTATMLDFQNFFLHRATKNINKNQSNIFAAGTKKLVSCNANE